MSDTNETSADIIADIRSLAANRDWHNHTNQSNRERISDIADRLEAALKREKASIEADALAVGGTVEAARHKPGNAAAMREALNKTAVLLAICEWPDGINMEAVEEIKREIDAALSAPPRNCDRYRTLAEALSASGEMTAEAPGLSGMGIAQLFRFCKWLFASAKTED